MAAIRWHLRSLSLKDDIWEDSFLKGTQCDSTSIEIWAFDMEVKVLFGRESKYEKGGKDQSLAG